MADAPANGVIADAAIVAFYPEIANIETFLGTLAAAGRKRYVVTLEDTDHGPAIEAKINLDLTGLGYSVSRKSDTVTIAF